MLPVRVVAARPGACPTRGRRPGVEPEAMVRRGQPDPDRPRGSSPACASRRPTATSPTSARGRVAAVEGEPAERGPAGRRRRLGRPDQGARHRAAALALPPQPQHAWPRSPSRPRALSRRHRRCIGPDCRRPTPLTRWTRPTSRRPLTTSDEAEMKELLGLFDVPAFARRGQDLEYALARLHARLPARARRRCSRWSGSGSASGRAWPTGPDDVAGRLRRADRRALAAEPAPSPRPGPTAPPRRAVAARSPATWSPASSGSTAAGPSSSTG